ALRIGHGPHRLGPAALRREVLPDRHPVPRVRRRVAVPLPVGGDLLRDGHRAGRVSQRRLHRGAAVFGHGGGGLRVCLAAGGVSMAVGLSDSVVVTQLDALANWVRKNSLWPMPFATACCGIELMATGASRHDIARFGAEAMRFSPRQCDLMIVAGRVVMKMLPVLQRIWLQMPEPKWCISMGACAS